MLGKKDKAEKAVKNSNMFVFGAEEKFTIAGSRDIVLLGTLRGKVQEGDEVVLTNPGDDIDNTFTTKVVSVEVGMGNKAKEAEDAIVTLKLENAADFVTKIGTVCYAPGAEEKAIRDVYINALGNAYISNKQMKLKDTDYAEMSIGDCVETWKLYSNLHFTILKEESEEAKKETMGKIADIAGATCEKILNSEELLVVYSKATGKPYMFSNTFKSSKGTMVTPPDIRIFTKAYEKIAREEFSDEKYEIKTIKNSADGKAFMTFFGEAFYVDGVCGVDIVYSRTAVAAQMMITPPDTSNSDPTKTPVINPDLMRWLLLVEQIGKPETDDEKTKYSMYYGMLSERLLKASFVIPMKPKRGKVRDGEEINPNNFSMPAFDGMNGRKAVYLYTDWKTVIEKYKGFGALVQTLADVIEQYDCAINYSDDLKTGLYIDKARYEHMKKLVETAEANRQSK